MSLVIGKTEFDSLGFIHNTCKCTRGFSARVHVLYTVQSSIIQCCMFSCRIIINNAGGQNDGCYTDGIYYFNWLDFQQVCFNVVLCHEFLSHTATQTTGSTVHFQISTQRLTLHL